MSDCSAATAVYNDVTRYNIWPLNDEIRTKIRRSEFIAIDTEFTGLVIGNASEIFGFNTMEWVTRATNMDDRYKAMANIAKTHSIVSLGLSVFEKKHKRPSSYNVHNFNFTLQAQNSHLINPSSLSFLAQNKFDLNKQATEGIRYFPKPNPYPLSVKTEAINRECLAMREIFLDVIRAKAPIVVHNGLFDLVYLYQAFIGPLPDTYNSFAYDLYELFPRGIFDTKYISENVTPGEASFLAYLFHKQERIQKHRKTEGADAIEVRLKSRLKYKLPALPKPEKPTINAGKPYCEQFALHGHCRLKERCPLSHDINFILDCQECEESEKDKNSSANISKSDTFANILSKDISNKRKNEDTDEEESPNPKKIPKKSADIGASIRRQKEKQAKHSIDTLAANGKESESINMYHTAAYDAYMTGYIFASYRNVIGEGVGEYMNKVYLTGKPDQPLLIKAGMHNTTSMTYKQTLPIIIETKNSCNGAKSSKFST